MELWIQEQESAGIGGGIRNCVGNSAKGFFGDIRKDPALVAKTYALRDGIRDVLRLFYNCLEIETDSLQSISMLD